MIDTPDDREMAPVAMAPIYIVNRLSCSCGGEAFFICGAPERQLAKGEEINNIECTKCHQMFTLSITLSISPDTAALRAARKDGRR